MPIKKTPKSKVDITEYKKLSKAFLIMVIDANFKASVNYKKANAGMSVEFLTRLSNKPDRYVVRKVKVRGKLAPSVKKAVRKTKGYSYRLIEVDSPAFIPSRCKALAEKIKELYPSIGSILPSDRVTKVMNNEVNEESVSWAESVCKNAGVAVTKDRLIKGVEMQPKYFKKLVTSQLEYNQFMKHIQVGSLPPRMKSHHGKTTIEQLTETEI